MGGIPDTQKNESPAKGGGASLFFVGFVVVIVFASVLRLSDLNRKSLWSGEIHTVAAVLGEAALDDARFDRGLVHRALMAAGQALWGSNLWAFRFFTAVVGVGFLVLLWRQSKDLMSEATRLFVVALAAFGAYAVQFSQELGPHGPAAFFGLLATFALWKWLDFRTRAWLAGYALALAAGLYSSPLAFAGVLVGHGCWLATRLPTADCVRSVAPAWLLAGLLFAPYMIQAGGDRGAFAGEVSCNPFVILSSALRAFPGALRFFFAGYHDTFQSGGAGAWRTAVLIAAPLCLIVHALLAHPRRDAATLLACAAAGPFLIQPWALADPARSSVAYGAILVLVGMGLSARGPRTLKGICVILLAVLALKGLAAYRALDSHPVHRENWRELALFLAIEAGPRDTVIVAAEPQGFRFLFSGPAEIRGMSVLRTEDIHGELETLCDRRERVWVAWPHGATPLLARALDAPIPSLITGKASFGSELDLFRFTLRDEPAAEE